MNGYKRISAALRGEKPDKVPVMLHNFMMRGAQSWMIDLMMGKEDQICLLLEYPGTRDQWWFDITEGLPDPIVKNGLIEVWDKPGIGVDFIVKAARKYLSEEDKTFFD